MKLPNWFKIAWWFALIAILTRFLCVRYPELIDGKAVPADVVVFVVWLALLLAPLFSEVSLLGITLKQQIDDLKGFVSTQIGDIKNDVRNAVDVRTTFSPHFTLPSPTPDAQLPGLEARIKLALSDALAANGRRTFDDESPLDIPDDVSVFFSARFNIEKELRRITDGRQAFGAMALARRRPIPISQLLRNLSELQIVEPRIAVAIREVYSVCSPAIHGEPFTAAQVSFVREVAPELVATLRVTK